MTAAVATGSAETCCSSCARNLPCESGCPRHGEHHHGVPELEWQKIDHGEVAAGRKGHFHLTRRDGADKPWVLSLDHHTVDQYEDEGAAKRAANHLNSSHEPAAEDFPTPQDALRAAVVQGYTHADVGVDQQGYVYRGNADGTTRVARLYFNKGKYHFDYPHNVAQPVPASARAIVERRMAAEQRPAEADQLQWFDAGNFYFARVPGGDYTISKVPGVHHLAWQPHGGRAVALGFYPSPESAQAEAVRHYHTLRAAPVYQAAEARAGYKPAGAVRPGDRLRDEDGTGVRVLDVRGAAHGRVHVTVERANGRQVTWNAAPDDQLQLAEAEMKLGIEPASEDYLVVDATGKTVSGRLKSLSDANALARQHGGYVKFVTGESVAGERHEERTSCRPWMRMEKDVPAFNACMQLADKVGPIEGHGALHSFIRSYMEKQDQECFVVVLLDTQMQVRNFTEVARGARDRVPTPVADVARVVVAESMQFAVYYGAMGVAVSHNHPSGKCDPSDADAQVTEAMEQACRAMGVLFVDHLVVGRSSYYSFKAKRSFRPKRA